MKIAIYARKSVYREDSISIESQIEMCRYEARGEEAVIYQDNGFSGKNTDRPDFQRMMSDIRANKISKVIVYRLDRISRSILDFSEMMDEFQKHKVDFISATERFDTSSPMGRAMLNICIVFAQLERETIQQRVADAYDSRSRRGFYMGGKIPYGFTKKPTVIDGIKTSMYEVNPVEASDIKRIFKLYSKPSATLGDVVREITKDSCVNNRGKNWNTVRISELMRNPVYVMADVNVYMFFKQQGANLCNPIEDFDGMHGCYLFSGENTNRKTWDLEGQNVVIAPHNGFIPSDIWLTCRKKLLGNHQIKTCKAKNSWLAGKVKCGCCGYAMTIKKSKTKAGRYFVCSGRANKICDTPMPTIYADEFEKLIEGRITDKLTNIVIKPKAEGVSNNEIIKLRADILNIENSIDTLIDKLTEADSTTASYINQKIKKLDSEKTELLQQISRLEEAESKLPDFKALTNVMSVWDKLSFDDKRDVVQLIIDRITVFPDRVEIVWKF
ncbi:MAG: recombinase family protein [Oscillospiraceae bacterium]|nr:recombinase family protein [Oscillospiraceae bacterium]